MKIRNLSIVRCIVACRNANGEPDFFFVKVRCNSHQYEGGEHYDLALGTAKENDYEPFLAYDEHDAGGKAIVHLFEWETATTVEIRQ